MELAAEFLGSFIPSQTGRKVGSRTTKIRKGPKNCCIIHPKEKGLSAVRGKIFVYRRTSSDRVLVL
jgi:hypothetical protein